MESFGWTGQILRVNLTDGTISTDDTYKYALRFVGGRGICAKIAWDEIPPGTDAFNPENRLIAMTGPLTGTAAPGAGRVEFGGVAPQTYPTTCYTRSSMGGSWGSTLKYAGFDGIVVQGKASTPVYLYVRDGKAEVLDAAGLWGLDIYATQTILMTEHGPDTRSIAIGQAGENLVRIAVIANETENAAGQGGFGAVMGAKKLKAIAVTGTHGVKVARPKAFLEIYNHIAALLPDGAQRLPTLPVITGKYRLHLKPIKGQYHRRYTSCEGCAGYCRAEIFLNIPGRIHPGLNTTLINCTELRWINDRNWDIPSRRYTHSYPELPKNMPTMDDFEAAVEIVVLGNKYGLNMIEVNEGLLPWLKLCMDEGVLSEEELGMTVDLSKGEFWDTLFRKIAYRDGFGDVLAEHLPRAADILKKGHQYLTHLANGFSEHHLGRLAHAETLPTWLFTGLAHMTDSRGPVAVLHEVSALNYGRGLPDDQVRALSRELYGDERSSDKTYASGKASRVIYHQHRAALLEAMVLCDRVYPLIVNRRVRGNLGDLAAEVKLFSAATGVDMTELEGRLLGERIVNLERAIMVREGRTRDSEMSAGVIRFLKQRPDTEGVYLDEAKFLKIVDEYYQLRGWDVKTGWPQRKTLERLDLTDVADELETGGFLLTQSR